MDNIDKLLEKIISQWLTSDRKEAVEVAAKLKDVLNNKENNARETHSGLICSSPDLDKITKNHDHQWMGDIFALLREAKDELSWVKASSIFTGQPNSVSTDQLMYGMVVGCEKYGAKYTSENVYLGFAYLPPGTKYPLHAHDAAEVFQVLHGSASWGPSTTYMTQRVPGDLIYHAPAIPHAIHVDEDKPLLTVFAWTGKLGGKFWFLDIESGERFGSTIKGDQRPDSRELYNNMAENYEEIVRGWGYNMPEVVTDKISELIQTPSKVKMLDLGCGDGLVGEALQARGFSDITGMDISAKMLEVAKAKNIYGALHEVDLMTTLPAESDLFDVLSCVGTTTYLKPSVFDEWLRVVKPDGLLVFTHKTGVMQPWEEEQERRERMGQWKLVYRSPPLYYLPTLTDPSQERVHVFVYRKV